MYSKDGHSWDITRANFLNDDCQRPKFGSRVAFIRQSAFKLEREQEATKGEGAKVRRKDIKASHYHTLLTGLPNNWGVGFGRFHLRVAHFLKMKLSTYFQPTPCCGASSSRCSLAFLLYPLAVYLIMPQKEEEEGRKILWEKCVQV